MKYQRLTGTDLEVSRLGVGCARLGGVFYGGSGPETIGLLRAAFDAGVTFYDTADMYAQGESERLLGKAFGSDRHKVVIASKAGYQTPGQRKLADRLKPVLRPVVKALGLKRGALPGTVRGELKSDFSPETIVRAIDGSLERLGTDYIDLYQLHGTPGESWDETFACLESLKTAGKLRYYGVSCETPEDALRCLEQPGLSVLQVALNLLHPETLEVIDKARAANVGIVARQCYAAGFLARPPTEAAFRDQPPDRLPRVRAFERLAAASGRSLPELAFAFVNSQPSVDVTLVGIRNQGHLNDALGFLDKPPLTEAEIRAALARG